MFTGTFRHQLDEKGRVRIPVGFRKELGANVKMYVHVADCLMVYHEKDYANVVEKRFKDIDILDLDMEEQRRLIFSRTQDGEVDKQGRGLLNTNLAKRGGIERNIVSIGAMDHVEIWDEATFDKYMAELDERIGRTKKK